MTSAVYAAGALCWRRHEGKVRILTVRRRRYDDMTLPKGKVEPGESLPQTAVREVREETGLDVALGVPLGMTSYPLPSGREKIVHYWTAEVTDEAVRASTFRPNGEVDGLEWVSLTKARRGLTYPHDIELVDEFERLLDEEVTTTFSLVVLRHAKAVSPSSWDGPDASRPLTERGDRQAVTGVGGLRAWGPLKIVSSTATRCLATVAPLAAATGLRVREEPGISQDAFEQGDSSVREVIAKRVRRAKTAVICSHGPVLPQLLREIALATGTPFGAYINDASALETAGYSVVHLSASHPSSGIIAVETHAPRV